MAQSTESVLFSVIGVSDGKCVGVGCRVLTVEVARDDGTPIEVQVPCGFDVVQVAISRVTSKMGRGVLRVSWEQDLKPLRGPSPLP